MESKKISIIVPTLAENKRADRLKRCINSIKKASSNVFVEIIVIVNGRKHDEILCDWIKSQDNIRFEYDPKPSLPNAIFRGRQLVTSDFFSFLDDDDEYLDGAINDRLSIIGCHPEMDLVVSNGYINNGVDDRLFCENLIEVQHDPLMNLFNANWLASCGALYRSSSFNPEFFEDSHPYAEWTWFAYKLGLDGKKIAVLDKPTFRINDTPGSLSKSSAYREAYFELFERMLERNPPREIGNIIKRKLGAAHHDRSDSDLHSGRYFSALSNHFKSLCLPGGISYLPYTRKFLTIRTGNLRNK